MNQSRHDFFLLHSPIIMKCSKTPSLRDESMFLGYTIYRFYNNHNNLREYIQ